MDYEALQKGMFIMGGPCVIENEAMILGLAEKIKKICEREGVYYIFKASFDKANRTSVNSFRGPGLEAGIKILEKVKKEFGLPVVTDIHESWQAKEVGEVIDIIQIPAFLARQTDLLVEAGKTGRIVNIKKPQFLSGKDIVNACEKVVSTGNKKILLTERGTMMGYNNLVVDFRNIVDMKDLGYPVVMDVTHSTQKPGGLGGSSGGSPEYAPYLARAASAVGVDGFFFEIHEEPQKALSDGANMLNLSQFEEILKQIISIRNVLNI